MIVGQEQNAQVGHFPGGFKILEIGVSDDRFRSVAADQYLADLKDF